MTKQPRVPITIPFCLWHKRGAEWVLFIPYARKRAGKGIVGHWPIAYKGRDEAGARAAYRAQYNKRIPADAVMLGNR